jgi:DNA polymerase-3 subunit epsilon/oligoribonuclease
MLGIFLDTETNGLNAFKHRIIEIAFKLVNILTDDVVDSYTTIVRVDKAAWEDSDPASLHINGFTYEQIAQGKAPQQVAQEIQMMFKKHNIQRGTSVFICQNPSFDRSFFAQLISPELQESLNWPYHWLDLASMYWVDSLRKGRETRLITLG